MGSPKINLRHPPQKIDVTLVYSIISIFKTNLYLVLFNDFSVIIWSIMDWTHSVFRCMALTNSDSVGGDERVRSGEIASMAFWRCRDRFGFEDADESVETFNSRTKGIKGVGLGSITKLFSIFTAGVLAVVGAPGFCSKKSISNVLTL